MLLCCSFSFVHKHTIYLQATWDLQHMQNDDFYKQQLHPSVNATLQSMEQ